ncbi:MAG: HAD family phosphatase [Verrucomicrobia bacterium]|nr:HAD family phosphatase [Verrucomicrobiota bacterium]
MKTILFLLFSFLIASAPLKADESNVKDKVLVFDFGGVIARLDRQLLSDHLRSLFHLDEEQLAQLLKDFRTALRTGIPEDQFWLSSAQKFNVALPENFEEQFEDVTVRSLREIDGMRALIKSYKEKGYRVALLSNVPQAHADFLRMKGWYDDFSLVLLSCEIGVDKPDPLAYRILLSRLQIDPENCIFIDDKWENVEAAHALGIDGIQFLSYEQVQADLMRRLD